MAPCPDRAGGFVVHAAPAAPGLVRLSFAAAVPVRTGKSAAGPSVAFGRPTRPSSASQAGRKHRGRPAVRGLSSGLTSSTPDSREWIMTSRQHASIPTTTLWRPTGPVELGLVRESGWRAWPPRLPEQPIFYPVLNEDYAIRIARDWNVKHDGAGFVTRFEVESEFVARYPVRQAGGKTILELWVPAEELDEFNAHIVGEIQVVHEFR
ncbi:hypothetical protein GCM10010271_10630 [Streptomyces kurssanovii]|nr:hypothetical protein GCM10010271_10630 [Streptomyces kurssanovii]